MYYFVTGGSRGIGAGIVEFAARRGHHVAFTYVSNAEAAERSKQAAEAAAKQAGHEGVQIRHYQLDVKDVERVEAVADQVLEDFETMEVIVNCAGVNRDNLMVAMSNEEWREVLATNLDGPFYVCRQFLQTLMANRFGRIINISSIQHEGGSGQANYAAAKAGLHGLTKTLAKEYGRRGITANVVVPGFFDTDMTRETMPQANKDYWKQYCPMPKGRMGKVDELAGVVDFLASEAGAFVNGEVINVTGGLGWTV
ncbi:putative 3-ketoacyl-acyl carrier protein reductase [Enhygromyxa salina]|uniref:Putative 3-ketoacyl-acyl carrier protein reductase n=1 Tax=Enhygromyxa salina TaxID=215803 RepID=A0A0C2D0N9_9BACT|nr:SDR family oxidoreductase [Enhygromyxa salina]KIG15420.1 putative 3-ketoacyl-acyl carrier protein reductase [Enhygromyxa salina]